jgi:hypothetical protein
LPRDNTTSISDWVQIEKFFLVLFVSEADCRTPCRRSGGQLAMGKKKKSTSNRQGSRIRLNPLTGEKESVPGTKAGKKRTKLPFGHPLRTHDK